ncbi:hypothetical protein KC19_2G078200 [Ceratodon purpureus]|uniref:Protein arginine N-methyltransferase 2 n=1 Tax=Ceratodon purpureus TaxID=3225 RepID=A0A8T0IT24_CERPU|nr:hypothetical protein KC19_2G078200 [Ceratodon purpureus]
MEGGGAGELQRAAAEGDLERVRSLLDAGADACEGNHEGMTPLMLAAQNGHAEVVRALLQAGAPWNALNPLGQCAGDFAMDAGHQEAFDILLDAGMQAELILGVVARQERKVEEGAEKPYLQQRVEYSEGKLLDEENKGVMMAWENPLMAAHAKAICANGGHVLNVGFGMGLVDTAIQSHNPASHTIIEAHPEVYKRMMETGWGEKPNVRILFGRWQDVLLQLDSYDGIFFDTYGEFYDDLKEFHEHLPKLLKKGGIYSYFNGLCATNAFFHVVYCQLVALELARLGLTTQFIPLPVKDCLDEETWRGVYHKYWQLDTYFLPVCQSEEEENEEDQKQ